MKASNCASWTMILSHRDDRHIVTCYLCLHQFHCPPARYWCLTESLSSPYLFPLIFIVILAVLITSIRGQLSRPGCCKRNDYCLIVRSEDKTYKLMIFKTIRNTRHTICRNKKREFNAVARGGADLRGLNADSLDTSRHVRIWNTYHNVWKGLTIRL